MTERSRSDAPQRRTARTLRPRRADHDHAEETADATSALVRYLTDPAIEADIQAFVNTAPPMSEVKRARIARLLGTDKCNG